MSNDNIIRDVKFSEKKTSERPAEPVLTPEAKPSAPKLTITPFDDGNVFKFCPHPKVKGQFVLYDRDNQPLAVSTSPAHLQLICDAVRMLFAAAAEAQRLNDLASAASEDKATDQEGAQENSVDKSEDSK